MSLKIAVSVDGGGIKGIIPSIILSYIEKELQEPLNTKIDFFAGTSTGGIIATALSTDKYSANDIVDLYLKNADQIFYRSIQYKIRSLKGLKEEKYPRKNFDNLLDKYFKHLTLKDCKNNLVITSYDLLARDVFIFKSYKDNSFTLKQVVASTTSAPTYFEPYKVGDKLLCDGAIYANNPSRIVLSEMQKLFPKDEHMIISLGCGEMCEPLTNAQNFRISQWARYILDITFDGQSKAVHHEMTLTLNKDHYYRLQPRLIPTCTKLDDTSQINLLGLKNIAKTYIHRNKEQINKIIQILKEK